MEKIIYKDLKNKYLYKDLEFLENRMEFAFFNEETHKIDKMQHKIYMESFKKNIISFKELETNFYKIIENYYKNNKKYKLEHILNSDLCIIGDSKFKTFKEFKNEKYKTDCYESILMKFIKEFQKITKTKMFVKSYIVFKKHKYKNKYYKFIDGSPDEKIYVEDKQCWIHTRNLIEYYKKTYDTRIDYKKIQIFEINF